MVTAEKRSCRFGRSMWPIRISSSLPKKQMKWPESRLQICRSPQRLIERCPLTFRGEVIALTSRRNVSSSRPFDSSARASVRLCRAWHLRGWVEKESDSVLPDFKEADPSTDVRQFPGIELLFAFSRGSRRKANGTDGIVAAIQVVPVGEGPGCHHFISFRSSRGGGLRGGRVEYHCINAAPSCLSNIAHA
jgi:hypothetical protein